MHFIKEYKSVICILLIAIFIFTFSTVVTSATIDDMDSFKELQKNNISEKNESGDIKTIESIKNEVKNDIGENNDIKREENNDIKESVKQENQNTSTNSLSKAGIEDTPIMLIIVLFVIASVYAYIKTNKYNNA
ncbi:MAG: hypothetical protein E7310_00070 [Clostridiales bacterium]|nr:hypothetical protein [Clostridiales bacterium]